MAARGRNQERFLEPRLLDLVLTVDFAARASATLFDLLIGWDVADPEERMEDEVGVRSSAFSSTGEGGHDDSGDVGGEGDFRARDRVFVERSGLRTSGSAVRRASSISISFLLLSFSHSRLTHNSSKISSSVGLSG